MIAGAQTSTLDASAYTTSVTLNATADTVSSSLIGGVASDLILLGSPSVLGTDTISGGGGSGLDTLAFTSPSSLVADSLFANVSGFKALSLAGGSNMTLGSSVAAAGINRVYITPSNIASSNINASALTASVTLDGSAYSPLNPFAVNLTGSSVAGSDFVLGNTKVLQISSLKGGTGIDTLALVSPGTVQDSMFAYDAGASLDLLSLSGAAAVTLGSVAQNAGFSTIVTGNANETVNASAMTSAVTLDARNEISYGATLTGNSSLGTDFILSQGSALALSSLVGGSALDTLTLSAALTGYNDSFAGSGIEILSLSSTASNSVTLSTNAQALGLTAVYAGSLGDTLTQGSDTLPLTFTGGAGNDRFILSTQAQLAVDSLLGGAGTNAISLTGALTAFNDSFKGSGEQILSLSSAAANSVTLSSNAQALGLSSIYGGNAGDTLVQGSGDTLPLSFYGGTGADSIVAGPGADTIRGFSGAASLNAASDTMVAGSGVDLFVLAAAGDTNNAYGRGSTNTAVIKGFIAGASMDKIQLHNFGASSTDYSTLAGGLGLEIFHTGTQTTANLVANISLASGTFTWANNATFI